MERIDSLSCFKAYDIRGKLGEQINEDIAYRIGRAYGQLLKPNSVVVGGDVRLTSSSLKQALANGLRDAGTDIIDLGMTGTEEVYFATKYLGVDGGVEITASHNPINYNGMKLVKKESRPISSDTGLNDIKALAESGDFEEITNRGTLQKRSVVPAYIDHLMSYVDSNNFTPMKLVVNSGNGAAGHIVDAVEERFNTLSIPVEFIKIHHQADGNFPNGIPNPLLQENREDTAKAVIESGADLGIAWDGDFDRCFLFDEKGNFVEGYYIVGMLAEAFLNKNAGAKVIHDPRVYWNTVDIAKSGGGIPIMTKSGHAFIKERMREEDAIYGGEMSAHHYFRDFAYCDSGMIPWLLVSELLCVNNQSLSQALKKRIQAYPASGEINTRIADPKAAILRVRQNFELNAVHIDETDGINIEHDEWRFNLRCSNTEPVVRLNVESKGDIELMNKKTEELLTILKAND